MGAATVVCEGVGKAYRLGELGAGTTLREAVTTLARRPRAARAEHVWALRDVSLRLTAGTATGVVGRNGSGKSTLLRVLAGITAPTEGVSRTRGRVASLLEVGTGFHDELTGRDNIHLNGAVLGMTRADVRARFDEIVAFAGIGRYLDTPLKRYSTGMHLRLAFAVAAHLEPDVLLVDEVLAVGDVEFQRRCLGRMREVEREGRTVVLVSHDLAAVRRLCGRAVWLDDGRVRADGPTGEVLTAYATSALPAPDPVAPAAVPAGPVRVLAVRAVDADGHPVARLHHRAPATLEVHLEVVEPDPTLDLALYLTSAAGVRVLDEAWSDHDHAPLAPGRWVARLTVPPVLHAGTYEVGLWVGNPYEDHLDVSGIARLHLDGPDRRPDRVLDLPAAWDVQPATHPVSP